MVVNNNNNAICIAQIRRKQQMFLAVLVPAHRGCPELRANKWLLDQYILLYPVMPFCCFVSDAGMNVPIMKLTTAIKRITSKTS